MQAPVEIAVDEVEQVVARVAGIDVAKASGMVCTRLPHESVPGRRVTRVWPVKSTTAALGELADQLREQGIERIVIESTSDYWRPFFYLLEAAGLSVWLVNAAQVKHVPGRPKTDKLDAVWLAKLAEKSMVSPSFVPAEPMRAVRDLARARFDLVEDRARVKQRVEKLLEESRPGARCPDCSGSVSPGRSPNPPCASRRNGLSAETAVMRGSAPRGSGCCLGSGTG